MAVCSWARRALNGRKRRFPARAVARIGGENERSTRNRGPFRHYIDLPMVRPFVGITGCRLAVAILRELLGAPPPPHTGAYARVRTPCVCVRMLLTTVD